MTSVYAGSVEEVIKNICRGEASGQKNLRTSFFRRRNFPRALSISCHSAKSSGLSVSISRRVRTAASATSMRLNRASAVNFVHGGFVLEPPLPKVALYDLREKIRDHRASRDSKKTSRDSHPKKRISRRLPASVHTRAWTEDGRPAPSSNGRTWAGRPSSICGVDLAGTKQ